jgi:hypothetical protein
MGIESIGLKNTDSSETVIVSLDDNNHTVYQLSRIAQSPYATKIIVPRDINLAVLGCPRLGDRSYKFVEVKVAISMVGHPRAHLVQTRC